jgi:hypothetical protein
MFQPGKRSAATDSLISAERSRPRLVHRSPAQPFTSTEAERRESALIFRLSMPFFSSSRFVLFTVKMLSYFNEVTHVEPFSTDIAFRPKIILVELLLFRWHNRSFHKLPIGYKRNPFAWW